MSFIHLARYPANNAKPLPGRMSSHRARSKQCFSSIFTVGSRRSVMVVSIQCARLSLKSDRMKKRVVIVNKSLRTGARCGSCAGLPRGSVALQLWEEVVQSAVAGVEGWLCESRLLLVEVRVEVAPAAFGERREHVGTSRDRAGSRAVQLEVATWSAKVVSIVSMLVEVHGVVSEGLIELSTW